MCARSKALGTRAKFQLEILITSTICAIHKFRDNFFESSRKVCVIHKSCDLHPGIQIYFQYHHQPRPSLVQIMACHLFSTKPLSEPMLHYCQLGPQEQTSVKLYWKFKHFRSKNCIWKCCLENIGHFVSASMCERGGHIHKGTVCNTRQTLQC